MIINDVQFNVSLEEVFEELKKQIELNGFPYFQKGYRPSGNSIQIQCPFHGDGQERKPSAGIRKSDGMFHCFACNEIHSLPEVISYCLGYDDMLGKEGWKWLLKNFATIQKEERKDVEIDYSRHAHSRKTDRLDVIDSSQLTCITEEELDSYRYYHKYWTKRGIVDESIIELFDLGYDSSTECITFPVRDSRGNTLFIAKRSVKTKWFNYPMGVTKPLYGLYELSISDHINKEVYITESMIDCILLWQAGYQAVALNGTGNDLQFKQLKEIPCRWYILATDNDEAGKKARKRLRANIRNKMITEIDFPKGIKDIGECSSMQIKHIKEWEVF